MYYSSINLNTVNTTKYLLVVITILVITATACKRRVPYYASDKPKRELREYFDKKYLLYKLPVNYYKQDSLNQTFKADKTNLSINDIEIRFSPLGYDHNLQLQYNHVYSNKCVYHVNDSTWKYAEVAFPNSCLTKDMAYASAEVVNKADEPKTVYLRMFYQNTSYWYTTAKPDTGKQYLDNYYGASDVVAVTVPANSDAIVKLPYSIGLNPKGEFNFDPAKDPARPGNYEFMLVADTVATELLGKELNLQTINPFAEVVTRQQNNYAYVGAKHFKFVFLDEYFDGMNDLDPNHVYIAKDGKEKPLCDTCSGWYRDVISENWNVKDYFEGFISKAPFVKARYGILKQNTTIDENGIKFTIPASKKGDYNKTWGEVLFGPSFKYGHLTVRAKFAPMFGKGGTPNGIIHNLWLYERDPADADPNKPYADLHNAAGKQPYEIDFEIWSSLNNVNTMWDDQAFINYSIVDYMRKPDVNVKPGEYKQMGKYKVERLNSRQAGIPGVNLHPDFFNQFHTYELYWYPDHVRFLLDGQETAILTNDMASIPNTYMFLWIGSPLYQDGTYFAQSNIPFLETDKQTIIDYIKIE